MARTIVITFGIADPIKINHITQHEVRRHPEVADIYRLPPEQQAYLPLG